MTPNKYFLTTDCCGGSKLPLLNPPPRSAGEERGGGSESFVVRLGFSVWFISVVALPCWVTSWCNPYPHRPAIGIVVDYLRQFIPPLSQHPLAQFFTRPRHRRKRIQPLIGPRGVDYGARIKTLLITRNNGIERTAPAAAKNFDIFHGIGPRAQCPHHLIQIGWI